MRKTHEVVAEENSHLSENSVDTRASLKVTTNSIGGHENDPRREREIRMECQNSRELVKGGI